jgi:DNA-binding response OmpR family regulator
VQRLLVAEDDPDIRDLVLFKLKSAGFDVTTVVDGRAALASALEEPPDLVLLDVMMPGLSGLEVCAALRDEETTARSRR